MSAFRLNVTPGKHKQDVLRINKNSGEIHATLNVLKYRDKDTRQIVLYCPSLELTGYGATEDKAKKMMEFSINDYFLFLIDLPIKKIEKELQSIGWKHSKLKNKEFSKAYVDPTGNLKNFNAVADKIENITIEA